MNNLLGAIHFPKSNVPTLTSSTSYMKFTLEIQRKNNNDHAH